MYTKLSTSNEKTESLLLTSNAVHYEDDIIVYCDDVVVHHVDMS